MAIKRFEVSIILTTRYLWDGNKVLHECKEYESTEPQELEILTTPQNTITWLYKQGTFVPNGKLTENDNYSIVSDHLGTPTEIYNSKGKLVWKIVKDIFGRVRHKIGGETKETDCQIRFQGNMKIMKQRCIIIDSDTTCLTRECIAKETRLV